MNDNVWVTFNVRDHQTSDVQTYYFKLTRTG